MLLLSNRKIKFLLKDEALFYDFLWNYTVLISFYSSKQYIVKYISFKVGLSNELRTSRFIRNISIQFIIAKFGQVLLTFIH